MKIVRVWDMPHKHTFKINAVKSVLARYVGNGKGWLDPFSNNHSVAEITNDLNPEVEADYNLEAWDFLKLFDSSSKEGVLLDPPYSMHQILECYEGYGENRINSLTPVYEEATRVIKPGGLVICFGWNSNGLGRSRSFELEEVILVPHGGHHNDTIITVERKLVTQHSLFK